MPSNTSYLQNIINQNRIGRIMPTTNPPSRATNAENSNIDNKLTTQTNLKSDNSDEFTNYAYFLGGIDARHDSLQQYDLQRKGYGRIFILRMPKFIKCALPKSTKMFKHMLEFGNTGISGINGYQTDFTSVTGGYNGDSIEIPVGSKDDTNSITIKCYETAGSLIRSYLDFWITGAASDPISGLVHYHGATSGGEPITVCQANQTMEAIYVNTDQTGTKCIYSCLLTNMFPSQSDHSHFDYDPGSHELVDLSIEFKAKKYMSASINALGQYLVDEYEIMRNYLNYQHGYEASTNAGMKANILAENGGESKITNWNDVKRSGNYVNGVF